MVGSENVSCFSVSTKTRVFRNKSMGNLKYREIKLDRNALRTFPLIYDYNEHLKYYTSSDKHLYKMNFLFSP